MEKRACQRTQVRIEADLICDYVNFAAFIGDISARGVHIITIHIEGNNDFGQAKPINLKFMIPSGEILSLRCRKRWSRTIASNSILWRTGMEIIDPPAQLENFLTTLQ